MIMENKMHELKYSNTGYKPKKASKSELERLSEAREIMRTCMEQDYKLDQSRKSDLPKDWRNRIIY